MGTGQGPRTPTETYLSRLWAEALGLAAVGIDEDFFRLGGSSVSLLSVLSRVGTESGVRLPMHAVFEAPTVRAMALLLNSAGPAEPAGRCLVALSRAGAAPPLFGIHGGGGPVTIYGPLSRALSPARPCYGLQAAGLSRDVEPDRSVAAMAQRYLAEIELAWPSGHLLISGYSMGGVIALEVARAARATREVTCILLDTSVDTVAMPQVTRSEALFFVARTLGLDPRDALGDFLTGPAADFDELGADVADLDDDLYEKAVIGVTSELLRQGLLPADSARADVERFAEMYAINAAAVADYRVTPYDGHVVLVAVDADDESQEDVIARAGWAGVLGSVTLIRARGDHHSFLADHAAELAGQLSQVLPS
jgi:thioesterase domain-containing protein